MALVIHEAVDTPDGRRIAYATGGDDAIGFVPVYPTREIAEAHHPGEEIMEVGILED